MYFDNAHCFQSISEGTHAPQIAIVYKTINSINKYMFILNRMKPFLDQSTTTKSVHEIDKFGLRTVSQCFYIVLFYIISYSCFFIFFFCRKVSTIFWKQQNFSVSLSKNINFRSDFFFYLFGFVVLKSKSLISNMNSIWKNNSQIVISAQIFSFKMYLQLIVL